MSYASQASKRTPIFFFEKFVLSFRCPAAPIVLKSSCDQKCNFGISPKGEQRIKKYKKTSLVLTQKAFGIFPKSKFYWMSFAKM